jgi:predicted ATP-grasp superfamily ATP-dependent carboligase
MKKVLVVGCYVMGLAVIRALHLKNIDTVAMYYRDNDIAHLSRYVSERVRIPHPVEEEKEFISFLVNNSNRWGGSLILATDDYVAVTISKNKDTLARYYVVETADWEVVQIFIEKERTYKLAEECGVPYPRTFSPKNLQELHEIKHDITYPYILKPVRGHEFKSIFNTKNFKVNNDTELLDKFKTCMESAQEVMVQEIIPGPDTNIYKMTTYINSQGNMSATFFYNKIRQNPPQFGIMRVGISTERNQKVELFSYRLLKHANFRGICNVEFRKDPRDNQLKLIEVNVRMNRTNLLSTYCGINFPWLIYMDLVENRQIDIKDYKENFYWIELYADIFNTIFRHRQENIKFSDYLKPYLSRNKAYAIFSLSDLMPFLKQTLVLPQFFLRSLNLKHSWRRIVEHFRYRMALRK